MARKPNQRDADRAQTRLASLVILVAMVLWLGLSALGGMLGLEARYAILLDMLCLAALAWALATLFLVWRRRSSAGGADKE